MVFSPMCQLNLMYFFVIELHKRINFTYFVTKKKLKLLMMWCIVFFNLKYIKIIFFIFNISILK